MHRMRHAIATAGLTLVLVALLHAPAGADLIHAPSGAQAYPEIDGAMNSAQTYTFNSTAQTGQFQYSDTPFLLMLGPKSSDGFTINSNSDGTQSQSLSLTLNQNGQLISSPSNAYALYGSVVIGGQTFNGLLLQAVPTAFGSQAGGSPAFDMNLTITGGLLAPAFGPDLYLQLHPAVNSTFDGSFNKSFTSTPNGSSAVGPRSPKANPAPEPTTLVVLLACGAGLFARRRFRPVRRRELERVVGRM